MVVSRAGQEAEEGMQAGRPARRYERKQEKEMSCTGKKNYIIEIKDLCIIKGTILLESRKNS